MNKKVVLIIGSDGSGKSALASFLFDPVEYENRPKFPRSKSIGITTTKVARAEIVHNENTFIIVDTPGINDYLSLRENCNALNIDYETKDQSFCNNEIKVSEGAIIFCHKVTEKTDEHFKNTLKYFVDLLVPFKNYKFIIVITDVAFDEKSIRKRRIDGFDLNTIGSSISDKVKQMAFLNYTPRVFYIDSNPLYCIGDEEYQMSVNVRNELFSYISQSQPLKT